MTLKEVYVIGFPGSGKRMLMALLSFTASKRKGSNTQIEKGSSAINHLLAALNRSEWPESEGKEIVLRIGKKGLLSKNMRLHTIDATNGTKRSSLFYSLKADGFIFIIDGSQNPDMQSERLSLLIQEIASVRDSRKFPPTAIAVSKCDKMTDDPVFWVEENFSIVLGDLRAKAPSVAIYPVRIYTEEGHPIRPLMVEGVDSLISWLLEEVR